MNHQKLVERFEEQLQPRQNLFVAQHRFLSLKQLLSEVIEDLIDCVMEKTRYCNFGALEEAMILQTNKKAM